MTQHVLSELQDRVLTIRFNRPDKKNALTTEMYVAFTEALQRAEADPEVRVILIAGSNDCFTSGNDLVDFLQRPPVGEDSPVARFMNALATAKKPVVAACNGIAIGVGTTLLLHCDLVYAGAQTRFHLTFVNIGICPEFASSYLMPRMMGHQKAAELLLLAEPFGADKARAAGFVNEVLPNDQTEARAREAALKLAAQPPSALRTSKALLKGWREETITDAIRIEAAKFIPMLGMPEAREAMGAFMQKRKPDFSRFE